MTRVLVLAPMVVELKPVVRALHLLRCPDDGSYVANMGSIEVIARLAGVGTGPSGAATAAALERDRPDHVVVVGIAGGLGPSRVGDLVVPATVTDAASGAVHEAAALGRVEPGGRLVTGDGLLPRAELDRWAADGHVAVDMETSAVAAACEAAGVAWTAFRGISDLPGDELLDFDTFAMVGPDGRTRPAAVARTLVRHPGVVPRMARLARGTRLATTAASTALHDALAA